MVCPHEEEIERLKDLVIAQAEELVMARRTVRRLKDKIVDLEKHLPENVKKAEELKKSVEARMRSMGVPSEVVKEVLQHAEDQGIDFRNIVVKMPDEDVGIPDLGFGGKVRVNPNDVN